MPTYIISECGINHCGKYELAKKMIEQAKWCGADAVKFQTFWHFKDLKQYELKKYEFVALFEHAKRFNIDIFSTPFSQDAINFLNNIGQTTWKIPSGMVTNIKFLKLIPQGKRILSTGMATMKEVVQAVKTLGTDNLTVLHCTTAYPTKPEDVNLKAMSVLGSILKLPIGLSDHTRGIEIPVAAVAMGASVIEKHFTLDRGLPGPDHQASLDPSEFKAMVSAIRNVEKAMGDGEKKPTKTELEHMDEIRGRMLNGGKRRFIGYREGRAVYV